jgi:hypothetical protein
MGKMGGNGKNEWEDWERLSCRHQHIFPIAATNLPAYRSDPLQKSLPCIICNLFSRTALFIIEDLMMSDCPYSQQVTLLSHSPGRRG